MTSCAETGYRPGAIVRLLSGGPEMTVTRMGEHDGMRSAWCVWSESRKGLAEPFPAHVLEPVKPEAEADGPDHGEAPCGAPYCRRLPPAVIGRAVSHKMQDWD